MPKCLAILCGLWLVLSTNALAENLSDTIRDFRRNIQHLIVDAIENHALDLGRWSYRSQTLVFIRDSTEPTYVPSTSSQQAQSDTQQLPSVPSSNSNESPDSMVTWRTQLVDILSRNKRYPAEAAKRRKEGLTIATFTVDHDGHLESSRIDQSSGSVILDQEVIDLLNRTQPFPPLPSDYSSREITLTIPIRFSLLPDKPDHAAHARSKS